MYDVTFDDVLAALSENTARLNTKWVLNDGFIRTYDENKFEMCPLNYLFWVKTGKSLANSSYSRFVDELQLEPNVAVRVMFAADGSDMHGCLDSLRKAVGLK